MTDIRPSADPTSCLSRFGWDAETEIVGLLPGSKPAKLQVGVPFCLAIANHLHQHQPQTHFIIPVAPGLTLQTLAAYANPAQNPLITKWAGSSATLVQPAQEIPYLQTPQGCQVRLWTPYPAYDLLANCQICVTTVGANTAELTALAVPMLVVIPTQQLDIMRAWDGLCGLVANLPILGTPFASLINGLILKKGLGLRAWPNIWAQQEIVPELVGKVSVEAICDRLQTLLETPTDLQQMHQALQTLRGHTGSVQRLVKLIIDVLPSGI